MFVAVFVYCYSYYLKEIEASDIQMTFGRALCKHSQ